MIPAFTGEGAKKNEYLNSPALRFSPDYKLEEAEFLASLDEQIKKLNENLDTLGFDPQFNQLEKKDWLNMVYGPLPIYPLYHPTMHRLLISSLPMLSTIIGFCNYRR